MSVRSGLLAAMPGRAQAAAAAEPRDADLILTHGAVYTENPAAPWAEAVAIRDGRILAVGGADAIAAGYRGPTVDLHGQMLLPGFQDAHTHPVTSGVQMLQCNLKDAATRAEILKRVRACNRAHPDTADPGDDWLVGGGWNLSVFPNANPDRRLLDEAAGGRPVFLEGEDGHSSWVSSAALARAGITADTPDPPRGVIERDAAGEPSGTLRESAQDLVRRVVPPVTDQQRLDGALAAVRLANSFGITSMADAAVTPEVLATWHRLEHEGQLTARVVATILMAGSSGEHYPQLLDPASRGSGALVRADSAKIFLDGVLEGETAALLEPYLDAKGPNDRGTLNVPFDQLRALVTQLDAQGIQVHMHAIGDRAVREGLDAIQAAREANGPNDNRDEIAHLQLVDPADYPRFAKLGVIANFQALWAYPDSYITDVNLPQVGEERVHRMYPIHSIEAAGGMIVGGSDWSVSSMNPLDAIEVGVTRQDPDGRVRGVLNADEAVSLATMLAAYTRNAAYVMHQDKDTGTIEPGKLADLVVLDHNLFEIDPSAINRTRVLRTYFAGRQVYPLAAQ